MNRDCGIGSKSKRKKRSTYKKNLKITRLKRMNLKGQSKLTTSNWMMNTNKIWPNVPTISFLRSKKVLNIPAWVVARGKKRRRIKVSWIWSVTILITWTRTLTMEKSTGQKGKNLMISALCLSNWMLRDLRRNTSLRRWVQLFKSLWKWALCDALY